MQRIELRKSLDLISIGRYAQPEGCCLTSSQLLNFFSDNYFAIQMHRLHRVMLGVWRYASMMLRLLRVILSPPSCRIVAITKNHPIYTSFTKIARVPGYVFYTQAAYPGLRVLDRLARSRVDLVHQDAANPATDLSGLPRIVECEGRPSHTLYSDSRVRKIFCQSQWAGGDALLGSEVELLRPACPVPLRRTRRQGKLPITVLAVGHGSMVKGWDALEKLWNLLEARYDLRLIVAGNGAHSAAWYPEISSAAYARADIPALLKRLKEDRRITLGVIPHERLLAKIYWSADVFVHLARMETFGFSILEAMSRELPVVATRLNAIPEMVLNEQTGFLVDTMDLSINDPNWAETIARAAAGPVERLIEDSDLRLRMGSAGRERVRRAFSVEYRERVLKSAYDQALGLEQSASKSGRGHTVAKIASG